MSFVLYLSNAALSDLREAVNYYNSKSPGLGIRMANEVDQLLNNIAIMPQVYSRRHRNVRAAKVYSFPYLIFYTPNEKKETINVLRIFNTYQQPIFGK